MNSANREHPSATSSRQRVIIVTFATVEQAEAWDADGQPIDALKRLHKLVIE